MKRCIKYTEVYDQTLLNWIEKMYKESFRRGWSINGITKMDGKWIVRWSRHIDLPISHTGE